MNVGCTIGIGPIKYIPQTVKGHNEVIKVSFSRCDLGMLENLWHLSHFLSKSMALVFIVGQKYPCLKVLYAKDCPSVIVVDPLVDFPKYVAPFLKVDTLQNRG